MGSAKAMSLPSGSVIMTVLTLSPDVRSLASMFSFPTAPPALPCWSQPGYPSRITEKSLGSFAHFQPITVSDDSSVVSLFRSKAPRFVRGWSLESIPQRLAVPERAVDRRGHRRQWASPLRGSPTTRRRRRRLRCRRRDHTIKIESQILINPQHLPLDAITVIKKAVNSYAGLQRRKDWPIQESLWVTVASTATAQPDLTYARPTQTTKLRNYVFDAFG